MDDFVLMQNMTDSQRLLFQNEVVHRSKSKGTAFVLAFFLGGVGAHHYYLGHMGLGVLYTLFFWTLIPALVSFIELFFVGGYVRDYNTRISYDAASKVLALTPAKPQIPREPPLAGQSTGGW